MKREGQRAIGPVALIIAGMGLAVAGFLWFAPPFKAPRIPEKLIGPRRSPPGVLLPEAGKTMSLTGRTLDQEGEPRLNRVPQNGRNPFQAPSVAGIRGPSVSGGTGKPLPAGPIESPLTERLPVWQGLLRTKKDQLVIVKYAAKTHFLRRGDLLPESSYRLTEIGPDYILFNSPNKQLKLARERKGN